MSRTLLNTLFIAAGLLGCASHTLATPLAHAHRSIDVPAGRYYPFFKTKAAAGPVPVPEFLLDPAPATRAEFLEFVRNHPEWRKSNVKPLFAENNYLTDWPDDLDPGAAPANSPVTFVSWFAARAYCSSKGKRLLTVAEWERVAGAYQSASAGTPAGRSAAGDEEPFRFAMGRPAADLIHRRMRVGNVWEWNADFNSAPFASRAEGAAGTPSSLFCGDGYRSTNAIDYAAFLRYSLRSSLRGNYALKNLGFRCARDRREAT